MLCAGAEDEGGGEAGHSYFGRCKEGFELEGVGRDKFPA